MCFSVLFIFIHLLKKNKLFNTVDCKIAFKRKLEMFPKKLALLLLNFYGTSIFITKKWVPALFKCGKYKLAGC